MCGTILCKARNRTGKRHEVGDVCSRGCVFRKDRAEGGCDKRLCAQGEAALGELMGAFDFFASDISACKREVKFRKKRVLVFVLLAVRQCGEKGAGFA